MNVKKAEAGVPATDPTGEWPKWSIILTEWTIGRLRYYGDEMEMIPCGYAR